MFKNFLKITFRNLLKNKLFVLINIVGLGIALACCIVAYLNWDYNNKFDTYHLNTDNVYRINFIRITNGRPIKNGSCPLPLGEQIKTSMTSVDKVIRYNSVGGNFKIENEMFNVNVAAVDIDFFNVFNFPMVIGGSERLADKQSIVISSDVLEKYFRDVENPIGETLTYINGDQQLEFNVAGVFKKPPKNTSFSSDAFILYDNLFDIMGWENQNWALFNSTFVTINEPNNIDQVAGDLQQFVEIQNIAKKDYMVSKYYLDPFQGMAIRAEKENIWNHWFRQSLPSAAAAAPGIMAFLLLLIACFNFTNTSIAIANRRIKEIGIRKVLGSNRKQLILQFLGENVLLVFMALSAGLIISAFLVPAYSAMWPFLEIHLDLLENIDLLSFLILLLLFTAIVAGCYPAIFISSFQPTTILRGTVKFSGTNLLTRILLTSQFAISLLAIISGFVFSQNATFQKNYDMGFDMESIVFANVKNEKGYTTLRNELDGYPQIKEMAGSRHSVSFSWYTDPIKHKSSEIDVSIMNIGSGYLSTIGASIIEGRDFMENSRSDADGSVIINQELARTMGWSNPINQRIVLSDTIALNVVGVVKDIYFQGGLWDPLEPMLLRYTDQSKFRFLTVRADTKDLLEVKTLMDEKWRVAFPDELSTVEFMDEEKADSMLVNTNIKVLFIFLGIVAALLSIIGLFSMVSLNLVKRMKEIGVRKVLGASILDISMGVSKEFIVILLIASIFGSIGGYFLSDMLMGTIWTYYVPISPFPFIASISTLFFVSILTIGGKVFKAASVNPAVILKDN